MGSKWSKAKEIKLETEIVDARDAIETAMKSNRKNILDIVKIDFFATKVGNA